MNTDIEIARCTGSALPAIIADLAALRVKVFREWPYLYDGDEAYEATYLQTYLRSPCAAVIVARLEGRIVGASTCLSLKDETENVQAPFASQGLATEKFFYFGESVLLPQFRGRGIGVAFFREREAHARQNSACDYATFCAVQQPADHPARPAGFVPLDAFWGRRGFVRRADFSCTMRWKEISESSETEKTLVFWMKSLSGAPLPPASLP